MFDSERASGRDVARVPLLAGEIRLEGGDEFLETRIVAQRVPARIEQEIAVGRAVR